jgi:hypothetical protein
MHVPNPGKHSQNWALGYLRGSASGYRRGTVSLRRVTASVTLALRSGVTQEEARRILLQHALTWDPARVTVSDGES